MTAISIAGMACRYADAASPAELWENVLAQRRGFRRIPPERLRPDDYFSPDPGAPDRTYALQAAVLDGWDFDRVRFRISGRAYRAADLAHWLALDVAAAALADAGYPDGAGLDRERTAVVVGNTLTGEFSRARTLRLRWPYVRRVVRAALERRGVDDLEDVLAELEHDFKEPFGEVDEETLAGGLSNTIAGRICNSFDFKGGGYTVDGACASSLLAVVTAAEALERGDVDTVVAGGVDLSLDPFELVGFAKAGALAADAMRVYDRRSQGFWPGEGCGFVVLRRLEDARAPVVIRGWGVSSDGTGGITRPELHGQLVALRRAYARAGFDAGTVQLFEGHGTGTAIGDATELAALDGIRREAGAETRAAIGSVKANIGHTKAAAGVAGLIKAALSVEAELIPPTSGCIEPHELLCRPDATLRISRTPEPWPEQGPLRAAVSAMGFGGVNTHVVLERAAPRRRLRGPSARERMLGASAQDAELFLFAGAVDDVRAEVATLAAAAPLLGMSELGDAAAALHARLPRRRDELRAAVVAANGGELADGLAVLGAALAAGTTPLHDDDHGVFIGAGAPGRVAYLFPGQGTAATADGGALARRFGAVRDVLAAAQLPAADDPVDTAFAQPAIVASALAGLALLDELGVRASVGVGHSLGELAALQWGGALDRAAAVRLAAARGRAMRALGSRVGAMASVAADADTAARLCAGTGAVVAGVNAPDRTVVSGAADAVADVVARAQAGGIAAVDLAVSHAFHSPLVEPAVDTLRTVLAAVELAPLRRAVVSTVTGAALGPADDLRETLARQVTAPVLFSQAVGSAAAAADLLVEVGPGRVLRTLAARQTRVPAVGLEVGAESLRPALTAAAALFAAGAVRTTAVLFDGRFARAFDPRAPHRFLTSPCERAPQDVAPAARAAGADMQAEDASTDALATVRELVAAHAELPVQAIAADARLLADLHLSSIAVGEIAVRAARALGCAPPSAPGELATTTVAELAAALERLAAAAPADGPVVPAGVDAWVRPFTRTLVEREAPARPRTPTRWTVVGRRGAPFTDAVAAAFAGDGAETGVVLALGDRRDDTALALLVEAARRVRELGADRFAVVEHGRVGGAFARVVHLEHGLPTTVVGVADASALAAACAEAESTSSFAEVRFDRRGERCVPLLRPLELEPGGRPLARGDLLLVSGGGKGIVAECALLLARRHGVRLLVLGRSDPAADAELAANLRRFAAAGVDARYVRADVCDAAAVRAAVGGARVRAVLHGAGVNAPALLPQIDVEALRATIAPKVDGLANILAALDGAQLRLVVTFGSIIGAMGLRGEAHYAVANDWLRAAVEDLAAASPQCRCLDVAWSVWAGAGMGERLGTVDALARAGVDAIPLDEGTELLDALLCDAAVSGSVVAAGRFGLPPTLELAPAARPLLRFPEETALEYPGIELVADARVGSGSDPYVEEHVLDGVRLLPAVIGLEAMAQAAASVAGAPPATLTEVAFERAVTIPPDGARLVRTAALARRDSVRVVLRSDESALQVDHFRATCHRAAAPGGTIALDDGAVELAPAEVYDRLLFHSGRFRRLVRYRVLTAHRCVAELAARDEPWFGAFQPGRLLLGDPGVHDALLHVLQACIPGERVLPVAADRIEIVRPPAGDRTVVVSGRERGEDGAALVWDVDLAELDGTVLERWRGLRLLRIGTPIRPEQWPLPLLVPYLERRVAELTGSRLELVVAPRSAGEAADARIAAAAHVGRDAIVRRANGRPEAAGLPVSAAHAAGLTLAVAGEGGVLACDVERVVDRDVPMWRDLLGRARFDLAATLSGEVDEALDATATRVWAAGECVEKAGASRGGPLTIGACADDGWVLLQSGGAPIATYAGRVEGVDRPLAFAFLTRSGR